MSSGTVSAIETPVTAKNVDFSNCDRELVQFPGAIQPHGVMLIVDEPGYIIRQVSANCEELLGRGPADLTGRSITEVFGDATARLLDQLHRTSLDHTPVHVVREFFAGSTSNGVNIFAHRSDGSLILEFERILAPPSLPNGTLYSHVRATMARLQATRGLQNFLDLAVEQIRAFTGYDRVMAYKFAEDLSGHVVAEAKRDDLEPYFGLHYPATDIPAPARRMFSLSWLRHLPDVDYVPVPLLPENHPGSGKPIDMSYAILRSVSVMYSGYLKNMGVRSTMVMPLMKDGALWGLISAMHHSAPRYVPYEARMAAEILAHMLSLLTAAKEDAEGADNRLRMKLVSDQLVEALCREPDLHKSLAARDRLNLLSLLNAQGGAVVSHGRVSLMGATPSEADVQGLAGWLIKTNQPIFATDRLPEIYEPAASFKAQASGVLAARLSSRDPEILLWFRPEHIETVNWAGDPKKPVKVSETDGEIRLMPRSSFALWKESVTGRCDPWHKDDKDAAANLRQAIMEVILSRAEEIERTNRALAEANIELDSFAYVASHDLKEPLRGIHHMASFLKRGLDGKLDPQAVQQIETILKLSRRMDDLIESLLQYSRTGRVEIVIERTDLDTLVDEALISCEGLMAGAATEIRRPKRLGQANCDRVQIGELLTNLISNAIKYNDKPERWVEIGVEQGPTDRYYVADNGIGLEADERERIFEIFRRIHGPEEFGGGVGAGLTIARKIVERHGGRMWIDSEPNRGSIFYFTLGPEAAT
jgi:two-component system, chemotaxis family, sensor kinase Cph1